MNKIRYEIFDGEAEAIAFSQGKTPYVEFSFTEPYDGFISIDSVVCTVNGGVAVFDTRLIHDGEFTPSLILPRKKISLPRVKKAAKKFSLAEYEADYIRKISLREIRLEKRIRLIEGELEGLRKSVYGTKIF